MTILNNDLFGNYVQIVPVKAVFTDSNTANVLVVQSMNDNLTNSCVFGYTLYNYDGTSALPMYNGTLPCTGTNYSNWSGDNTYPYTFVAGQLRLTVL